MKITKNSLVKEIKNQLDKVLMETANTISQDRRRPPSGDLPDSSPARAGDAPGGDDRDDIKEMDDETLLTKSWKDIEDHDDDVKFRWLSLKVEGLKSQVDKIGEKPEPEEQSPASAPPKAEEEE